MQRGNINSFNQKVMANEHEEHGHGDVPVFINNVRHMVAKGFHSVVDLKNIGGVPLADELEQVMHGKLVPLPDDGKVEIGGGEKFVSHPRDSASS
ncbi:hypothetical protein EBT31_23290 [bacterium]|nr:hypothetical protein [bacterium]